MFYSKKINFIYILIALIPVLLCLNLFVKASALESPLLMSDSVFSSSEGLTLRDLAMRVFFIIMFSLGILAVIKIYSNRNRFSQQFFGNFSSFSNTQGLKLIQTLILTPGQNIYLIEVQGKKLLIGGTREGGVQFLADLTKSEVSHAALDFKEIEEHMNNQSTIAEAITKININGSDEKKDMSIAMKPEVPFVIPKSPSMSPKKPSFRRSLNLSGIK